MSKATKLRFALITEDVLDKLRPRSQSENSRTNYMNEISVAIRMAVNEVLDEKMQQLNDTVNRMVEERVSKILESHLIKGSLAGRSSSVGRKRDLDHKESKGARFAAPAASISSLRVSNIKRGRNKRQNPTKDHVTFASDDQLTRRPRTKAQKITVMPIHRESQVKSTPSNGDSNHNNTPMTTPPPPLSTDKNKLDEDDYYNFSDVEEPSILSMAAKYLKKLEDVRRRKHSAQ
ncbi:GD16838 [Drosophila simulans]|uniref:GD16838 n=1 Tax=Drosophila simulans TaxID=7240 RepID=B4R5Y5_DROSI|nr:GD16838 [Drosophila simulans]